MSLVALRFDAPKDWAIKATVASAFTAGAWLLWQMAMQNVSVGLGVVLWLGLAAAVAIGLGYAVLKRSR